MLGNRMPSPFPVGWNEFSAHFWEVSNPGIQSWLSMRIILRDFIKIQNLRLHISKILAHQIYLSLSLNIFKRSLWSLWQPDPGSTLTKTCHRSIRYFQMLCMCCLVRHKEVHYRSRGYRLVQLYVTTTAFSQTQEHYAPITFFTLFPPPPPPTISYYTVISQAPWNFLYLYCLRRFIQTKWKWWNVDNKQEKQNKSRNTYQLDSVMASGMGSLFYISPTKFKR